MTDHTGQAADGNSGQDSWRDSVSEATATDLENLLGTGVSAAQEQILRQLDTRTDPADCVSPGGNCPLINECRLRGALARAREAFYAELDSVVIGELPQARQMAPVFQMIGLRPGL